ncbi:MAG: MerR family transcriptional regulator [Firmicutes bacterium]|nr:MerR family transcriptional regulator [Bacillota bacterium]
MEYYKVGEFAKMTGLTIRALRYYDEIDLLKPCNRTEKGYRLYSDEQLIIVQQILTLKFLDFSIEDIKEVISNKEFDIKESLRTQKEILDSKIDKLKLISNAIDEAYTMEMDNLDWKAFQNIIEKLKEDAHIELVEKYSNKDKQWVMKRIEENHEDFLKIASSVIEGLNSKEDNILERVVKKWIKFTNEIVEGDKAALIQLDTMLKNFSSIADRKEVLSKRQLNLLQSILNKHREQYD